ncbi:MAG: PDZ domain-containing protein [bacterium]|nr:PDZ domain-containing protein [bacterium]
MRKIISILFILLLLFVTVNAEDSFSRIEKDVKHILKKVSPSIVKVVAVNHRKHIGSGVAITRDNVITHYKVVNHRYDTLFVETVDGRKVRAKVIGKDKMSRIVLLKLEKKALTPIKRAKGAEVGDWAALVGLFYNEFPSICQGYVSSASDEHLLVNAPVVPGSIGGAVINKKGELMGMIRGPFGYASTPDYTYKDHKGELYIKSERNRGKDLCFTVPTAKALSIAKDLVKFGRVKQGWLGVTMTLDDENIVRVKTVVKGSPAELAGFLGKDGLLKIDGKKIKNTRDVIRLVRGLKPGQKVKIDLLRDNQTKPVIAVIGDPLKYKKINEIRKSKAGARGITDIHEALPRLENRVITWSAPRVLGIEAVPLTPQLAQKFKVKDGMGLMISKVDKESAAGKAGIKTADVIVKAGKNKIRTHNDLRTALSDLEDNEALTLKVYRTGKLKKIRVVPDKADQQFIHIFDSLKDKLMEMKITVDDENQLELEVLEKMREARERSLKNRVVHEKERMEKSEQRKDKKELELYKRELKKMKIEQERLRKKMEKMMKLLEKERAKDKKKDNDKEDN